VIILNAEEPYDDESQAATKIQAVFRGYKVRRNNQMKPHKTYKNNRHSYDDDKKAKAATKIAAGVRGFLTRKRLKHPSGSRVSLKDRDTSVKHLVPSTRGFSPEHKMSRAKEVRSRRQTYNVMTSDEAAVRIQSHYRGYLTRQKLGTFSVDKPPSTVSPNQTESIVEKVEIIPDTASSAADNNEDVLAATKIQARFRGYKTRKSMKNLITETKTDDKTANPGQSIIEKSEQKDDLPPVVIQELVNKSGDISGSSSSSSSRRSSSSSGEFIAENQQ
jgi:hypothetical protein